MAKLQAILFAFFARTSCLRISCAALSFSSLSPLIFCSYPAAFVKLEYLKERPHELRPARKTNLRPFFMNIKHPDQTSKVLNISRTSEMN